MNKYIHEITIGNIVLKNNVFLGPMAGVTDKAFRSIVRSVGAPALTFTEMASSKAMEFDSKKTKKLIEIEEGERPSIVQIFGSDKTTICNMIEKLNEDDSIDIIDINMGCPAPKLVKNGDGAGLLLNLDNVRDILENAVKVSKKPITVKTRKGFNDEIVTAVEVAKIAEKAGVSAITIHGRTKEEYYSKVVDLDIIKKVKESVNILVIGNGDITSIEKANEMFKYTKCDAIMISRGALGNPWIFKEIIEEKEILPSAEEKYDVICKHIDLAVKNDGEESSNLKLRKHMAWYIKGIHNGAMFRNEINTASNTKEMKEIMKRAILQNVK